MTAPMPARGVRSTNHVTAPSPTSAQALTAKAVGTMPPRITIGATAGRGPSAHPANARVAGEAGRKAPAAPRRVEASAPEDEYVESFIANVRAQLDQHPLAHPAISVRPGAQVPYRFTKPELDRYGRTDVKWLEGQSRVDQLYVAPRDAQEASVIEEVIAGGGPSDGVRSAMKRYLSRGETEIPLQELIPSKAVQSRTGTFPAKEDYRCAHGPNCLTAALQWDDSHAGRFFVGGEEFEGLLEAASYRKLAPGEPIHFGDVLAFRDPSSSPPIIHAERFLTPDYVWHKNTKYYDDPWTFESLDSTLTFLAKKWREREEKPSDIMQLDVWTRR